MENDEDLSAVARVLRGQARADGHARRRVVPARAAAARAGRGAAGRGVQLSERAVLPRQDGVRAEVSRPPRGAAGRAGHHTHARAGAAGVAHHPGAAARVRGGGGRGAEQPALPPAAGGARPCAGRGRGARDLLRAAGQHCIRQVRGRADAHLWRTPALSDRLRGPRRHEPRRTDAARRQGRSRAGVRAGAGRHRARESVRPSWNPAAGRTARDAHAPAIRSTSASSARKKPAARGKPAPPNVPEADVSPDIIPRKGKQCDVRVGGRHGAADQPATSRSGRSWASPRATCCATTWPSRRTCCRTWSTARW